MSDAQPQVRYIVMARVASVTREGALVRMVKEGETWVREEAEIGWFLLLEGSHEKLFLGTEPVPFKRGDNVRVIIEPCK